MADHHSKATSTQLSDTISCQFCGTDNSVEAQFCAECGKNLSQQPNTMKTSAAGTPPPPVPSVQKKPSQSADGNRCPNCSTVMDPHSQFCGACGSKRAWAPPVPPIIVSTMDYVPGKNISENLGVAMGNTVRAKHFGKDLLSQFKNLVGGEIEEYTMLFSEARQVATQRMIADAVQKGADAVINVRFLSSMISQGMSELLAYGTAVKFEDKP